MFSLSAAPAPAALSFSSHVPRLGWKTPAQIHEAGDSPALSCQGMETEAGAVGEEQVRPKETSAKEQWVRDWLKLGLQALEWSRWGFQQSPARPCRCW